MKHFFAFLVCFALLSSLLGCAPATGEMTYEGIYVKAANGQHILIDNTDDGEQFFLLNLAEDCRSMDELETGDNIKITVACLAYENVKFSERRVLDWSKASSGHTNVPQTALDQINEMTAQYESK